MGPHGTVAASVKSRRRRGIWVLLGLVIIVGAGLGFVRWYFSGARLGAFLIRTIFPHIRGSIEIDSVDWPPTSIFARHLPCILTGLRIYDPNHKIVMEVPRLTATVDWVTAALPGHDVLIDDLRIDGANVYVESHFAANDNLAPLEVGFVAAFQPPRPPPGQVGRPPGKGPVVEVHSLTVSNVHLELRFPVWQAIVEKIAGSGMLRVSFQDPKKMDFVFALEAAAPSVGLDLLGQHLDLTDFEAHRFGQFPIERDALAYDFRARTVEGATLHGHGKLSRIYDPVPGHGAVELTLDVRDAGKLIERLSRGNVGGDAAARIDINGPMSGPRIEIQARGAATKAKVLANIDHVIASLDIGTSRVDVKELEMRAFGGAAEITGYGSIIGRAVADLQVHIVQPMSFAAYLPPQVVSEAGSSRVSGRLDIRGIPGAFDLDKLDLELGRIHVRGNARLLGNELHLPGLDVDLPEAHAHLRGAFALDTGKLALDFDASAPQASALLARLGLPALAGAVEAKGHASGTPAALEVTATVSALGVPTTSKVDATLAFHHDRNGDRLEVQKLAGDPLGGTITASANVLLGRAPRILDAKLDASGLSLARLPVVGRQLGGTAHVTLTGHGTALQPRGEFDLGVDELSWAGTALGQVGAHVTADEKRVDVERLHIGGASEGSLDLHGTLGLDKAHKIDMDVALARFPLAFVTSILPAPVPPLGLAGVSDIQAHLGGELAHPTAAGHLDAGGLGLLGSQLGDARIDFAPTPDGKLEFHGHLLHGKMDVDGQLAFSPGKAPILAVHAAFRDIDLQEFLPELAERLGARCRITGYLYTHLEPGLHAELHLTEVELDVESQNEDGESVPIVVKNKAEIAIAYDGDQKRTTILSPIAFESPTGEFTVNGFAGTNGVDLHIAGKVYLGLFQFYLRRYVDKVGGTVVADVHVTGTPDKPIIKGAISMSDAVVQRHAQETQVKLPSGTLVLNNDRVEAKDVIIDVDGYQLSFDGSVTLSDFRPVQIDARLEGRVAGRLIEIAAPNIASGAGGSAYLSLAVTGNPQSPSLQGTMTIDSPLSLVPRGFRKEITLRSGQVRFANQRLTVDNVAGEIEDGTLSIHGDLQLSSYEPVAMLLYLDVEGYRHRIPEVLEIEVNAQLTLTLRQGQLALAGDIDVVDGAFVQRVAYEKLVTHERTAERSEPFWKGSPMLADMSLALHLQTTGSGSFVVHNQVTKNVSLSGDLTITGTPPKPAVNGQVHVQEGGTLSIPGTKVKEFTIHYGEVSFSPYRSFPDQTPYLDVKADAPFTDLDGTDHIIYLQLTGTLTNPIWNLSTNTGLNQAKTISLITFGRTTDSLRARARGESSGVTADPTLQGLTAAPGQSNLVVFSDEIVKEFTGEFISILIEDPVKNLLSLDCFHLLVGAASITSGFCYKLGSNIVFNGDYEQGFGWYHVTGSINYKAIDDLFLVMQGSSIKSLQEAEGVQNALQLQLKDRFIIK